MKPLVYFFFSLLLAAAEANAQAFTLKDTPFGRVGAEHNIDPLLLYSISLHVSSRYVGNGLITPSPFAIRSPALTKHFDTKEEAEAALLTMIPETDWIDVGLMQINLHYHPQSDPASLLDPYKNLSLAAKLLKQAMASTDDPILGVGRYFTWTEEARNHGETVWTTYSQLRAMAFEQGDAR